MEDNNPTGGQLPIRPIKVNYIDKSYLQTGLVHKIPDTIPRDPYDFNTQLHSVEPQRSEYIFNPWKFNAITDQLLLLVNDTRVIDPEAIRGKFSSLTDELFDIVLLFSNSKIKNTFDPKIGHFIWRSWRSLYNDTNLGITTKELAGESILLENANWIYYVMNTNDEVIIEIEDVRPIMTLVNIYQNLVNNLIEESGDDRFVADVINETSRINYSNSEIINNLLLYSQLFLELYIDKITDEEWNIISEFYDNSIDFIVLPEFNDESTHRVLDKEVPVVQIRNAHARYIGREYNIRTDRELVVLDDNVVREVGDRLIKTMEYLHDLFGEHLPNDKKFSIKYFNISEVLTEYYIRTDKRKALDFLEKDYIKAIEHLTVFNHSDPTEQELYFDMLDYINYNIITKAVLLMDLVEDPLAEASAKYLEDLDKLKAKFHVSLNSELEAAAQLKFKKYLKIYESDVRNTNDLNALYDRIFNK